MVVLQQFYQLGDVGVCTSSFVVEGSMEAFQCVIFANAVQVHVAVVIPHWPAKHWVDVIKPRTNKVVRKLRRGELNWGETVPPQRESPITRVRKLYGAPESSKRWPCVKSH